MIAKIEADRDCGTSRPYPGRRLAWIVSLSFITFSNANALPTGSKTPPATARAIGQSSFYEIVYADANIGASSGGHSGLKFGRTVYHYQMYRDGIFRLVREDWSDFRRLYNDRENRTLGLRKITLPPEKLDALKDFFALRFLVQLAHLEFYSDLRDERELWRALSTNRDAIRIPVPGYGLFAIDSTPPNDNRTPGETPPARELGEIVAARTGRPLPELLRGRRKAIYERLRNTLRENLTKNAPRSIATSESDRNAIPGERPGFHPDRLPVRPELFSQKVHEDLTELAALDILEHARPLKTAALFDPYDAALRDFERDALRNYRTQLTGEILRLLRTSAAVSGADRGATLLLNQARHRAVSLSLRRNRLLTLDPFPARRVRVTAEAVEKDRVLVHRLAARAREAALRARAFVFTASGRLTEKRYNRLEAEAGRYFETRRGANETGYSIRAARSPMIPGTAHPASFAVPAEALPLEWTAFARADGPAARLSLADKRTTDYLAMLRQGYDYHLIRKNCVTELLRSIEAGGGVPAGRTLRHTLRFIPFVAFDLFAPEEGADAVDDDHLRWLPSYRKRRLARIIKREGALARPRESFATNSTIYTPRRKDTSFLLFTDDIFWARPLYGALNLVYGLGAAGGGLVSAPFDRGDLLQSGLRGALFSLPELIWFNIRKGSFDLPEAYELQSEGAEGPDAPDAPGRLERTRSSSSRS